VGDAATFLAHSFAIVVFFCGLSVPRFFAVTPM